MLAFPSRLLYGAGAVLLPAAVSAELLLNELHVSPHENHRNDEFVEILNHGPEPVLLDGWRLSGGVAFAFPPGHTLDPGAYLVVALDPSRPLFSGLTALGPFSGRLDGDGETLRLTDPAGAEIDVVDYRGSFPWPIGGIGDGSSLELLHPDMDNDLGSSWRPSRNLQPSPGAKNSVFTESFPPNLRQVRHEPQMPTDSQSVLITAKVTAGAGLESVLLHYQIVEPGNYIPAWEPHSRTTLLADPKRPRRLHSGYTEGIFSGFWPTTPMHDDGENGDAVAGDGVYSALLPPQPHRTLLRYYLTAADPGGNTVRGPLPDDPSLNFAYFTYNGVPDYVAAQSTQGGSRTYSADVLETLPVYHLLTRNRDWVECLAYSGADQHPRQSMDMRRAFNWSGTIVYDGNVYDNISYRLRGGNGRYHLQGKRSMKFRFNAGHEFAVRDVYGDLYDRKWRILTTSKMYGNRLEGVFGTRQTPGNFGLVDYVNGQLWELFGVPACRNHWFHFRVIDGAEEAPDQWSGDFYGMNLAMEHHDSRFLESRNLVKGNLYKLTDTVSDGKDQQRYQAAGAVVDASDYLNIKNNLRASRDDAWLRAHVNWDLWYRYTAVEEALRHYDYWPEADKNMAFYFEPVEGNPYGLLWQLPYDSDATWGPTWNSGIDLPQNAVNNREPFQRELRNSIREFRDLVWREDVIFSLIDDAAAFITAFQPVDYERWRSAPAAEGREDFGTLASKVADMKLFAFTGNLTYPGGNVGPGGRAAHLDAMAQENAVPRTPEISYTGAAGHPIDALSLASTPFAKSSIFVESELARVEWRIGEITDPEAPAYDPESPRLYEIQSSWMDSTGTETGVAVPPTALRDGHTYLARVRHWDHAGRATHWSPPYRFTATAPATLPLLREQIVISEIMYHPAPVSPEERAAGWDASDFEFIEIHNRGTTAAVLSPLRFTKGVDFDFETGAIQELAPGGYALIIANAQAFAFRYGGGLPIAGVWDAGRRLSNAGERLKLSYGAGHAIHDFEYHDESPWPEEPDGTGPSLVLVNVVNMLADQHGEASSWTASAAPGGSPGTGEDAGGETLSLTKWLENNSLGSDPFADPNQDGLSLIAEYALALDLPLPAAGDVPRHPRIALPSGPGALGEPILEFRVRDGLNTGSAGVRFALQTSRDLRSWQDHDALAPFETTPHGDGARTLRFRLPTPPAHLFVRLVFRLVP
ncbi:MAG TPA: lamin tail domain-containing protein [Verrucomicrobiales bacterium]|nr:lamin tail domain-containing protein [Verrucomicrobiales bacterium]